MKQQNRQTRRKVVLEQAANWMSRLQAGDGVAWDDPDFLSWMGQSDEHRAAFANISALWFGLDDLDPPQLNRPRAHPGRTHFWQPLWRPVAVAALLLLALSSWPWMTQLADRWRADEWVPAGQIRNLSLADGSTVLLGPDAALQWLSEEGRRGLRLLRGEAFFTVTPDPQRPFIVAVDGARVEVLGTRFGVALKDGARVGVSSGRVEFRTNDGAGMVLNGGQQARLQDNKITPQAGDPDEFFSWATGQLVLRQMPLVAALERLEPFAGVRIVLLDSQAGQRKMSSVIDLDHAERGIAALAEQSRLELISLPGVRILY